MSCNPCGGGGGGDFELITDNPYLFINARDQQVCSVLPGLDNSIDLLTWCFSEFSDSYEPPTTDLTTFCSTKTVVTGPANKQITLSGPLTSGDSVTEPQELANCTIAYTGTSLIHRIARRSCNNQITISGQLWVPYGDSYDVYTGQLSIVSANYTRSAGAEGDGGFVIDYSSMTYFGRIETKNLG